MSHRHGRRYLEFWSGLVLAALVVVALAGLGSLGATTPVADAAAPGASRTLDQATDVPSCVSYVVGLGIASSAEAQTGCQAIADHLPPGVSFATMFNCIQGQIIGGANPQTVVSTCVAQYTPSPNRSGTSAYPNLSGTWACRGTPAQPCKVEGGLATITQSGSSGERLTFLDETGATSPGGFDSPTQVHAYDWNFTATLSGDVGTCVNRMFWSVGVWWVRADAGCGR